MAYAVPDLFANADWGEQWCPKCGTSYRVTVHRFPNAEPGHFDCQRCGLRLKTWCGALYYVYQFARYNPGNVDPDFDEGEWLRAVSE